MSLAPVTITPLIQGGPSYTLADAGFVATLTKFEAFADSLAVATPEQSQAGADALTALTKAGKDLEAQRETLSRPALDWQRLINNTAKPIAARIDAAKRKINAALTDYALEQEKIAAAKERECMAELYRLEEVARKEREAAAAETARLAKIEADRLAKLSEEQRKREAAEELDFVMPAEPAPQTATERKIEQVLAAPVVAPVKAAGVRLTKAMKIRSIDIAKLPEAFVTRTAKEDALRKTYCVGWKEGDPMPACDGVVFEVVASTASTGRWF